MGLGEKELCMEHSGCDARITKCEDNDKDIFRRLHEVEKAVWMASATTGVITAVVVTVIQRVIH